jgi:hypothetical protein
MVAICITGLFYRVARHAQTAVLFDVGLFLATAVSAFAQTKAPPRQLTPSEKHKMGELQPRP